ncbi:hypothetical protein [Mycobacterium sp. NPDC050853]|uniref:hypothetical protein n=1 Tax=Mycobacterium sp. NPDC050853 TaxID=3155160 RepID=UPI0033EFDCBC
MAVHGVAGYAAGCRCAECTSAQRAREAAIAKTERQRWAASDRDVTRAEAQRQARLEREQARTAHQEQARTDHMLQRLHKQQEVIERQRLEAAQEVQRQRDYEQALAGGDYAWLLADQRRATQHVRNQINLARRHAEPGALDELQWRQAQQIHQLIEQHHAELIRHSQNPDK